MSEVWDKYVQNYKGSGPPGSEWGSPALWAAVFLDFFVPYGATTWSRAVEIGQGAGKYTRLLLDASSAEVACFDVSARFLAAAQAEINSSRAHYFLLDGRTPGQMHQCLRDIKWAGRVDAFYSIDSMVHVDLQILIAYLVTAAANLQEGGHLILTLADPTTEKGFSKLLSDIRIFFDAKTPVPKFEFVSKDMIENILERLGFTIKYLDHWSRVQPSGRDLYVVAQLTDIERGRSFTPFL